MTRAWKTAVPGLVALAVAMGIGRFAFTPILPMMQHDHGITLAQGGWLASANYAGYLVGAMYTLRSRLRAERAIVLGLAVISVATLAAAFVHGIAALVVLRFLPGFASALVLVYVSVWALEILAREGRPQLGGTVYAGVGCGIVFAGLACLVLAQRGASSDAAWAWLGATSLAVSAWIWRRVHASSTVPRVAAVHAPGDAALLRHWRFIYAQGAFGFAYIIPATFLPIMAKRAIDDPAVFGWAWPVFGAAAAVSTLIAAKSGSRLPAHRVWRASLVLMALGVASPVVVPGLTGIIVAALAVGATFMVATMAGMQEAGRVAGSHARVLMGAMTAAFALGQCLGPLLVGVFAHRPAGFSIALLAAAAPLLLAAWLLRAPEGDRR